jgi:hypothetical protein
MALGVVALLGVGAAAYVATSGGTPGEETGTVADTVAGEPGEEPAAPPVAPAAAPEPEPEVVPPAEVIPAPEPAPEPAPAEVAPQPELVVAPATDCKKAKDCNTAGYRLYKLGEHRAALSYFLAASALDSNFALGTYNAACAFALLGDAGRAVAYLKKLEGMSDPNAAARIEKARTDSDFDGIREAPEFVAFLRDQK